MQYRQGSLAAMQQLEQRTDEQLLSESRHRPAARAVLGARAAERYDVKTARRYFNEAMAGAQPQERPALRQMMKASMALAERRPNELKEAMAKLGQTPPSNRQLLLLRVMGVLAPPPHASLWVRARSILTHPGHRARCCCAGGFGIAKLVALPFGGVGTIVGLLLGLLIVTAVLGVMALLGRRRQSRAKAAAAAARGAQ